MATRIRKDIWKLSKINTWEPTIKWYALGIRELQKRGIADPTSWRYQAAIHDYDDDSEALRPPNDPLPKPAEMKKYWKQCQHFSWFFLPWHRWYLYYFEQMILAAIKPLGGPADWALPYWNYSDTTNPDRLKLPPAFIAQKMQDNTPNPLFVSNRARGNNGAAVGNDTHASLDCLKERQYTANLPADPGYGGPKTAFNHEDGDVGALEAVPHGAMHNRVGDWMSGFSTAGLDPIFWLHHSNIDRLWVVWRKRNPQQNTDPTENAWRKMSFPFRDAQKAAVTKKAGDAVNTVTLGYEYQDVSDPLGGAIADLDVLAAVAPEVEVAKQSVPEMLGANEQPVPLTGAPTSTRVEVNQPEGPALAAAAADPSAPQRMFLRIENVKGTATPNTYQVYVNVPEGQDPRERQDLFVGILPLFGVREASRASDHGAGSGLHYSFDITELAQRKAGDPDWNPANLKVTFVPDDEPPPPEGTFAAPAPADEPRFEVGRVSLYVA